MSSLERCKSVSILLISKNAAKTGFGTAENGPFKAWITYQPPTHPPPLGQVNSSGCWCSSRCRYHPRNGATSMTSVQRVGAKTNAFQSGLVACSIASPMKICNHQLCKPAGEMSCLYFLLQLWGSEIDVTVFRIPKGTEWPSEIGPVICRPYS